MQEVEDPTTNELLEAMLKERNVTYKRLVHAPARTSAEAAEIRGVPLSCGAKALLIKNSKAKTAEFFLVVFSAVRSINWQAIKTFYGSTKLRFATESEVAELLKCIPGAVPPFGSLFGLRTFTDESLFSQGDFIYFNAGLRTVSVSISTADYKSIEAPIICNVTDEPTAEVKSTTETIQK